MAGHLVRHEEIFENAQKAQGSQRLSDLLDKFAPNCILGPFAELDTTAERAPAIGVPLVVVD